MHAPLLSVSNLKVNFRSGDATTTAVNDISFEVSAGEILAIVGESGSGKSVTSLSLMQLLPSQAMVEGTLLFSPKGRTPVNLQGLSAKEMNRIRGQQMAMIFQEPMTSLNPVLTCGKQVMEAIQLHQGVTSAVARQQVIELFEKVQLPNPPSIINRYPHQLSGGQKQRVMIAMAISCNPSLLIADEPTTALDVTVQKTILDLIRVLQRQLGMGVILITHDLGLVADIADRVLVMYRGEIAEQGPVEQILQHPRHPYTQALLACRPAMHQRGSRLPVVSDFLNVAAPVPVGPQKPANLTQETPSEAVALPNIAPAPSTVLEVTDLKVHFPAPGQLFGKRPPPFKAVDGVSFTVSKGETLGLVGESGCGKTTLGRAILQLVPVTSGSIVLNQVNLAALSKKQLQPIRKDLQIIFQDPYGSLNPRLTIGEAILEPMQVHGVLDNKGRRKDKVIELLEKVNLSADHFNRYPHEFSGGQRQRICIARALALNPSFLIFDESVSALDVSVQAQVLNLLNGLKKEFGFTAIFISHDLSVVRFISDRILVMLKGRIVEAGASDDVYFNPREAYTRQLIEAIPGKKINVPQP